MNCLAGLPRALHSRRFPSAWRDLSSNGPDNLLNQLWFCKADSGRHYSVITVSPLEANAKRAAGPNRFTSSRRGILPLVYGSPSFAH